MSTIDLLGIVQRAVSAGVTGVLLSVGHLAPAGPADPPPRAEESRSALPWEATPWDGLPWDGTLWDTPPADTTHTPQPDLPATDAPADGLSWDAPPTEPPVPDLPVTEPSRAGPPPVDPPPVEPPVVPPPVVPPPVVPRPVVVGPSHRPAVPTRTPDPAPVTPRTPPPVADTSTRTSTTMTTTARDTPIRSEEFDTAPPARDVRTAGRASVRDGVLTLSGAGALCWTGARTGGRWEVRMRVPAAQGAVVLAGADPRTGEIRFADLDGSRASYAVRGDTGTTRGSTTVDAARWHVWTVEWTPAAVVGLVDGKEWFRADAPAVRGPLFLCLQARQAATLEVDHVREYAPRR
ncbi:MAG: hypothetical protein ABS81_23870 [Pseudonocardia sp. SCN 72-86]|nr:MAG: hypothetical protein ABS81_23870 [Pseudonocardia sp. SCN 72-86]